MTKTEARRESMTFRFNRNFKQFWKLILLGVIVPFFLLPFIHYHPETTHSHFEQAEVHQHSGRYHSATLEAYAHLVKGHFSDLELDNHFHHSHSSEENTENDSEIFILAKTSKPLKQGLAFKMIGLPHRLEFSNHTVSVAIDPVGVSFKSQSSGNLHSSRSPPYKYL